MSTYWPTTTASARCRNWNAHDPHGHCRGVTHIDTLTLSQIEAVANALGLDPSRLTISLATANAAQR